TFLLQNHEDRDPFLVILLPQLQWKNELIMAFFSQPLKTPLPVYIFQSAHCQLFHMFQNSRMLQFHVRALHVLALLLDQNEISFQENDNSPMWLVLDYRLYGYFGYL